MDLKKFACRMSLALALTGALAPSALAQNTDPAKEAQLAAEKARAKAEAAIKDAEAKAKAAAQGAQPEMSAEEAAMMAAWEAAATPGPHHAHLEAMAGEWESKTVWWMAPGTPPNESAGTASAHMILDGRFLVSDFKGEMMGMPFHGIGTWGYNNITKQYESTWIDNFGTMTMLMTGTCSDDGKVFKMEAKYIDPMTGQDSFMKETCTITGPGAYKLEMYGPSPDGKGEFKMMEITFKKVGNAAPAAKPAGH
jgi:hypothetical protein